MVLIVDTTGESLEVRDFFVTNASTGSGYYGSIKYILTPNGCQRLSNSIFTRQAISERKPLEVHIKINGEKRLVMHHDVFEKNEAIVFVIDNDGKVSFNVVPRKAERGFADKIRGMLPPSRSAAYIEALIVAAKPLSPKE